MCLLKKKEKSRREEEEMRIEKPQCFALKPEHSSRGIWRKPLKPSALSQLVGIHRLSARYMGGWVEFRDLEVLDSRNHSSMR